ncbi:MAG TPA: PPC domain-containing DNA-binding protein, partial [Anaerolineales bacterium]|nr:PPC domain-containing DNA-binding protein [Anaerolineales bacterium]
MQNYTFRLTPGQDLFDSIQAFVMKKHVQAGCVLSGVGSLRHASIRLADRAQNSEYSGPFEIVSMTGTLSIHGSHLH